MGQIAILVLLACIFTVYGQNATTTTASTTQVTVDSTTATSTTSATTGSACPEACLLPKENGGRGKKFFTYYYFDINEKECKKLKYTGRNGNANKFRTKDLCKTECEIEACGYIQSGEDSKESDEDGNKSN